MIKRLPLVSIITVTFNADKELLECIASVSQQSYPNIEHIIIDGGSTDKSLEILKANSHRITFWKSEPDSGIYDAMNKGIDIAKGDWIFFLGADDRLLSEFSKFAYLLKDHKTIYYGKVLCDNAIVGRVLSRYEVAYLNLCHQSIFYPRIVFEKYKYELKYKVRADHYLNIQCFGNRDFKTQFYPILICRYNTNGYSSRVQDPDFSKDLNTIIDQNLGFWISMRYKLRSIRHWIKGKKV